MNDEQVSLMLSTNEWLRNFGLRSSGLDMKGILEQIGFKHCHDFDFCLQKPVCSRYGTDCFQKYFSSSGKVYNLMNVPILLAELEDKLKNKTKLLKDRLSWLTTGSRKLFGLLLYRNACIVADMNPRDIEEHREQIAAFKSLMEEQISKTVSFTFIRVSAEVDIFSPNPVLTSANTINRCTDWLDGLPAALDSHFRALSDALTFLTESGKFQSIYLLTDGVSVKGNENLFLHELSNVNLVVNICCFMCSDSDTFKFLKDLARVKLGRFHAYSSIVQYDQYTLDDRGRVVKARKSLHGIPEECELSPDVIEMHQEIEEANCNLDHLRALLVQQIGSLNKGSQLAVTPTIDGDVNREHSTRSSVWLKHCGLKAKGLRLKDSLAKISFRHCDQSKKPNLAGRRPFSAKFCDRMVHLKWGDDSVVHAHITDEFYQAYLQKMGNTLALYDRRLKWLSEGSRRIFGNITESRFYLTFDASQEMGDWFDLFREHFKVLLYEQVKQKESFNVAALNSQILKWKERPVNTTEENLDRAIHWMSKLKCHDRVSVMDGTFLKSLTGKDLISAVYLVLTGTPENIPENIRKSLNIARKIRFHTISFNCKDDEVNTFLMNLATETKGRFHYYSTASGDAERFGGEDIQLVQNEVEMGRETLSQMTQLRNECSLGRNERQSTI